MIRSTEVSSLYSALNQVKKNGNKSKIAEIKSLLARLNLYKNFNPRCNKNVLYRFQILGFYVLSILNNRCNTHKHTKNNILDVPNSVRLTWILNIYKLLEISK